MPEAFSISPKQKEGMEICRRKQFVLFSGPRLTGKTQCSLHCLPDHAWRTDRGNISICAISQSTGLDSGVWKSLTQVTIPSWIKSGMGMKWARKPYTQNVTKRPCCSVTNSFGGISEFQLDSLKIEREVEDRFKSREFTALYVPELSHFREKKTFDIWSECLRAPHLTDDKFLFLADTNPSDDGEQSWIYFQWFILPKLNYDEYCQYANKRDLPILSESALESYKASLGLLEFQISDNVFLSKARVERLEATYASDPDLHDRYIKGLWKQASTDALFSKVFRPRFHVVGEIETPGNPDPEILVPELSTSRMPTGWDPGDGVNSAFCIVEKTEGKIYLPSGKAVVKSIFKVLDELVITGEDHSLDDFTEEAVKLMEWWEDREGKPFEWEFWSDRSVFDRKEPRHKKLYHQIIYEASGGSVVLRAADRGPGSVQQRIQLLRKLLFEGRIRFSNDKCPRTIEMCRSMRPGKSGLQPIQKGSVHKHPFDSLMYCIASESYDELEEMMINQMRTSRDENQNESSVIAIPM
jgi:hypothetical protein